MRRPVVVALTVLCAASSLDAQTPADPWKKVPPLQTTCYDNDFSKQLLDVHTAVVADIAKQNEVNGELERKVEALGQQEIMRRMIAYMQKDPQAAMKMMQSQQAAAGQTSAGIMSGDEAKKEREAEFAQLTASFNSEMDAGAKPFRQRRDEIMGTSRKVLGPENWEFTTKAAETEFNDMIDRENADYEQRCSAYFGPDGKVHEWLASYRETVLDPVAKSTEANDEIKATQMAVLDSPGASFHTTAHMEAVRDYIIVASKAYELRRHKVPNVRNR